MGIMRRKLSAMAAVVLLALAGAGCEGPQGPEGPVGPVGPEGPRGPEGPEGRQGGPYCSDCHAEDATIVAIQLQYEASVHGTYTSFERDTNPCNTCHTDQGFRAKLAGETVADVANPARVNCRTCHQVHTAYDSTDYALSTTAPVELMLGGTTLDVGVGNLCAECHQARVPSVVPAVGQGGQSTIPRRYGTHHGPQATVFAAGAGLPVFQGIEPVPTEPFIEHVTFAGTEARSCAGCHMQEPYGVQAGGHTWGMTYAYHGSAEVLNDGTCDACHVDATTEFEQARAEVEPLLDDLAACLVAEGVMDATGSPNSGATADDDLLAAFLIWQTITEDGSYGAHHPTWVPAILSNANDYLDANYPATCAP